MALACALAAVPVRSETKRERGMAETVTVGRIESFEAEGGSDAKLTLEGGVTCLVPRDDRRFEFWSTTLKEDLASGRVVFVSCDASSRRVSEILSPMERQIERVGAAPDGERLAVQLYMSPSLNFILTTRPGYAELRARLAAAVASKEELLVTTAIMDLEVLDARPVPPKR